MAKFGLSSWFDNNKPCGRTEVFPAEKSVYIFTVVEAYEKRDEDAVLSSMILQSPMTSLYAGLQKAHNLPVSGSVTDIVPVDAAGTSKEAEPSAAKDSEKGIAVAKWLQQVKEKEYDTLASNVGATTGDVQQPCLSALMTKQVIFTLNAFFLNEQASSPINEQSNIYVKISLAVGADAQILEKPELIHDGEGSCKLPFFGRVVDVLPVFTCFVILKNTFLYFPNLFEPLVDTPSLHANDLLFVLRVSFLFRRLCLCFGLHADAVMCQPELVELLVRQSFFS